MHAPLENSDGSSWVGDELEPKWIYVVSQVLQRPFVADSNKPDNNDEQDGNQYNRPAQSASSPIRAFAGHKECVRPAGVTSEDATDKQLVQRVTRRAPAPLLRVGGTVERGPPD